MVSPTSRERIIGWLVTALGDHSLVSFWVWEAWIELGDNQPEWEMTGIWSIPFRKSDVLESWTQEHAFDWQRSLVTPITFDSGNMQQPVGVILMIICRYKHRQAGGVPSKKHIFAGITLYWQYHVLREDFESYTGNIFYVSPLSDQQLSWFMRWFMMTFLSSTMEVDASKHASVPPIHCCFPVQHMGVSQSIGDLPNHPILHDYL